MLTAEQIQANYNTHIKIIEAYVGTRRGQIYSMIEELGDNYTMSPASTKHMYHNAIPGGYIDHVNRVVKYSLLQLNTYKDMGGIIDFEVEELVVAALFHDLGKIGDGEGYNYLPQENKWRRDNLGEIYINNPDLDFMLIQDRSLYLLQKYGIKLSQQEYIGIRIHDGVFDDANKAYFFNRIESSKLKSNLVHILHTADYLASKVEADLYKINSK